MAQQRKNEIMEEINQRGQVRVTELSKKLGCSEVTIRKDIQELSEQGLVIRTHGGAVKCQLSVNIVYPAGNIYKNADKKIKIAHRAYEYIQDQDTIILDDSSMSYYMAECIKENPNKHLIVITNSLVAAGQLIDTNHVDLIVVGGQVGGKLSSTMGQITEENFGQLQADKAFISAHGVNLDVGMTSINSPQAQVKKTIVNASKEVFLLADSSKFGGGYVLVVCPISKINQIITDDELDKKYQELAMEKEISLEVV